MGVESIFCGIVVFPFYPFLPPFLPPSLQPAAHHIPPCFSRICSWTCSLLEGKKRQYYIAIMRCWLPCLTLYCQSRSRSPEAGRKKKLKVVRQEHDFPPEILFVVVQHIPKRRGDNKRALIHPKDTVLTHKTYQQQTSYYLQCTAYYQLTTTCI